MGFKIPTGGRQTSWLFTREPELLGLPRNSSYQVVGERLEPATSGYYAKRPNHSTTLPPQLFSVMITYPTTKWRKKKRIKTVDARTKYLKQTKCS